MPLAETVEQTVDSCIRDGILADFLKKNRAEAIDMCLFEFDEEEFLKCEREYFYEKGMEEGREEGIKERRYVKEGFGEVPDCGGYSEGDGWEVLEVDWGEKQLLS